MRRIAAIVVAASVLVTLAACSSTPTRAECGPSLSEGSASKTITASGDFGSTSVTASFPTPLVAKKGQVSVLTQGTGALVEKGDYARFVVTQYDAKTGTLSGSQAASYIASDESNLSKVFECVNVGSRISAVVPTDSGTYAFVFDITGSFRGKADGAPQVPTAGFPGVVTAPDGTPGVTVANLPIPTTVRSELTKAGTGATVKTGDTVVMNYTVFAWTATKGTDGVTTRTATVGTTTWGELATTGGPITAVAGPYDATAQTGFFPGTEDALTGAKVGSQVVVIVPPDKSFPKGTTAAPDSVPDGATRIYVIDILDTAAATK